jgi:hypothetical protein
MALDSDGYGPRPDQSLIDRLLEECRTLSPVGIERIAEGWLQQVAPGWTERTADHHEEPLARHSAWVEAERAALHVLEESHRTSEWDALRNRILDLTEHHNALVAWRAEHGDLGHRAEDALLGAGLALCARPQLDDRHVGILLGPMSAALPWLASVAPAKRPR